LAPIALLASLIKLSNAYLASIVSISIVLATTQVIEAILVTLALHFILNLKDFLWYSLRRFGDITVCDPTGQCEFQFKNVETTMHLSQILSAVSMGIVSVDQVTCTFAALATGWLPSSRILCFAIQNPSLFSGKESVLLDFDPEFAGWGIRALNQTVQACRTHHLHSWTVSEKYSLAFHWFPKAWSTCSTVTALLIVIPHLVDLVAWIVSRSQRLQQEVIAGDSESDEDKRGSGVSDPDSD